MGKNSREQENSQKRILVMDDEELVRLFAEKMFDKLGYEVETVREGEAALRRYKEATESGQPFSLVILDISVHKGLGGKETIKALREYDPEVTAVVSSGYTTDPVMVEYEAFGFQGRISKPFELDEIIEVLNNQIS